MNPNRFSKMLGDVSREFDRPRDILDSRDLSPEQKIKLLKEWELDLRELQVASEENMTGNTSSGTTAELLRECRLALAKLGATDGDSGAAPTKQGGA
jgi:DNA topoisomerase IB